MNSTVISMALLGSCLISIEATARSEVPAGCTATPSSKVTVNVKERGAKGDRRTDDTAAIQQAINEVAGKGGTVVVPDGVYMVNAAGETSPTSVGATQLSLKSNVTLQLSKGAVLKAIPNAAIFSSILTIAGVSNVAVIGGLLEGDREHRQGTTGEWGMGIRVIGGAQRVTISGVTAKKMWGDGFYIDGANHVALCGVVADHNRRQGLSVVDADGLLVANSVFKNTRGTAPSAGIDLEPDNQNQRITNVRIIRSKFTNNAGAGILIHGIEGLPSVSNVEITNNLFTGKTPIKIKYAPGVLDSAICHNRYIVPAEPSRDLTMVSADAGEVTVLAGCGDPGLRIRY